MDISIRFREITLALFLATLVSALLGVAAALSGEIPTLAAGWGLAADGLGVVFTVRASIAFINDDEDYVESFSVLAAFMFTVFALAAPTWLGFTAACAVTAAWRVAVRGRRREWRDHVARRQARRAMLRSLSRSEPPPIEPATEDRPGNLEEREALRRESEQRSPVTRRGLASRARSIDGDPWDHPPG